MSRHGTRCTVEPCNERAVVYSCDVFASGKVFYQRSYPSASIHYRILLGARLLADLIERHLNDARVNAVIDGAHQLYGALRGSFEYEVRRGKLTAHEVGWNAPAVDKRAGVEFTVLEMLSINCELLAGKLLAPHRGAVGFRGQRSIGGTILLTHGALRKRGVWTAEIMFCSVVCRNVLQERALRRKRSGVAVRSQSYERRKRAPARASPLPLIRATQRLPHRR